MPRQPIFLVAVHALFIKDTKVLLSERSNTGYMDGFFSLPAGHVEPGEGIVAAMKREIAEETGLILPDLPDPVHVMRRIKPQDERIDYFFMIENWLGELSNAEPEKCASLTWFSLDQLPANTVPYVRQAIEYVRHQQHFSDYLDQD
jgi:ADP-ribose pyrophosphatase YjhB (NUDIX family)